MEEKILEKIKEWTTSPAYDENTRQEIQALVDAKDEKELTDRFYKDLDFGTGGLRGTMGAGTNRMNVYNVRKVTQGLANYMIRTEQQSKGIVVGRDSRIMSDKFAQTVAEVMIANNIPVYFYEDIHPTPTVSFAIRELGALAGVMVTASHNPKEYNGYKVFWSDGAQVTPPHDTGIIEEVKKVTELSQVKRIDFAKIKDSGLFEVIDEKIDPVYLEKTLSLSIHPEVIADSGVKICYSPLHGTGYRLVPESLKNFGFKEVVTVAKQMIADGNFPTAPFPNPEIIEAMQLGISEAKKQNADVFIATDPDADRIGAALKQPDGDFLLLNGNQIASLLAYYILSEKKATGNMPAKPRLVTTIVTTGMILDIAKEFDIPVAEVLTGFKWIGLKAREYEENGENFVFGCEESHGYNAADFVRDKDAVNAASLFSELTAFYRSQGKSVVQVLNDLYQKFGYYRESQVAITLKGKDGAEQIQEILKKLRTHTPKNFGSYNVLEKIDIDNDTVTNVQSGEVIGKFGLPKSNVILLKLSEKAKIVARPSGTEPKIKFYFTTYGKVEEDLKTTQEKVNQAHEDLKQSFLTELGLN